MGSSNFKSPPDEAHYQLLGISRFSQTGLILDCSGATVEGLEGNVN